jgi:hypothetical protein
MMGGGIGMLAAYFASRTRWAWVWTDEDGEHTSHTCFRGIDLPLLRLIGAHHDGD